MKTGMLCGLGLLLALAAVTAAGTRRTRTVWYCQRCGVWRTQEQINCPGFICWSSNRVLATPYSRIFPGAAACPHDWRFLGSRSRDIRGQAEIGDSRYSGDVHPQDPRLDRLGVLGPARAAAVLAALPLHGPQTRHTLGREDAILEALPALNNPATPAQAERWWRTYRRLWAAGKNVPVDPGWGGLVWHNRRARGIIRPCMGG